MTSINNFCRKTFLKDVINVNDVKKKSTTNIMVEFCHPPSVMNFNSFVCVCACCQRPFLDHFNIFRE